MRGILGLGAMACVAAAPLPTSDTSAPAIAKHITQMARPAVPDMTVREIVVALARSTPDRPANFSHRVLYGLDLSGLDFKHANLAGANLYGADLTDANLSGADLSGADLDRTVLIRTRFTNANLSHASIFLPAAFSSLETVPAESPRFDGANLAGALIFGRLGRGDWHGANLTGARLGLQFHFPGRMIADLSGCDLSGATLSEAALEGVDLAFADLHGARLDHARLRGAELAHVNFDGADLTGADLTGADLEGAQLRGARGTDAVRGLPGADLAGTH